MPPTELHVEYSQAMPSKNDDTRCVPLGPLDHIAPCNIPQSIIYLGLKQGIDPQDAFACLQEGLRRTILQAPWLNGRVYLQPPDSTGWRPGQLEIRYKPIDRDEGSSQVSEIPLRFNELPKSTSFDELREAGIPLDIYDDEALLWTSPFKPDFNSGAEVFAAQANAVPGGFLLTLSIAAPASDGTAMLSVTKMWAEHCSSLSSNRKDKTANASPNTASLPTGLEGVDRSALDSAISQATNSSKLPKGADTNQDSEFRRLAGIGGFLGASADDTRQRTTHDNHQESGMKPSVFYMPQPMYTELRQQLASAYKGVDVSGNNIVCAFIWRTTLRAWAAVRARQGAELEKTATLAIPFDARPNLSHLIPANYLGNVNFEHVITLPLRTLISTETSIPWVAKIIHAKASSNAQEGPLLEAYGQLRSVPEYDQRNVQIRASRLSTDSPCVGILSPMVLPFNGMLFGDDLFTNGGKPEAFRPMMGMCNHGYRTCFVIPRKQYGGLEFVMTLSEEEREFLQGDDEFSRYAFPMT